MEFFGERWCSRRDTGSEAKGTREEEKEDVKEEVDEEEEVMEKKEDRGTETQRHRGTERAMIRRDRAGSTCSSRYRAWVNASL